MGMAKYPRFGQKRQEAAEEKQNYHHLKSENSFRTTGKDRLGLAGNHAKANTYSATLDLW